MGGGPAESLPLVRDLRRDDLVENADLIREEELEFPRRDLEDFLDLAFPEEPNRPAPEAENGQAS
jgi:hypothetical protein